jgi:hypothetical protein
MAKLEGNGQTAIDIHQLASEQQEVTTLPPGEIRERIGQQYGAHILGYHNRSSHPRI